jgi:hypothetical protein
MAPKAKESSQEAKKPVKLSKAEMLDEVCEQFGDLRSDMKEFLSRFDKIESMLTKVNKKKTKKALNPIPVPEPLAKFITNAIKNKKLSDDMMTKMEFTPKTTITTKDTLDRNQVSGIVWDYVKKNCKTSKDDNDKTVYDADSEVKSLLKVDEFKVTNFQTYFAPLYPKSDPKKTKKTKKDESSDSDSSDSESDSESESESESDSESDDDKKASSSKAKAKPAPKKAK